MSKNNTIRKSDKKFIRREKARIRATVLDLQKQKELIDALYLRILPKAKSEQATAATPKAEEAKVLKEKTQPKKSVSKKVKAAK